MCDPTDYHRKLAEAIVRSSGRYEPGVDRIAAVLASEGVVDPVADRCQECNAELSNGGEPDPDGIPSMDCEVCRLRAEVERWKAALASDKATRAAIRAEVKHD